MAHNEPEKMSVKPLLAPVAVFFSCIVEEVCYSSVFTITVNFIFCFAHYRMMISINYQCILFPVLFFLFFYFDAVDVCRLFACLAWTKFISLRAS